MSSSMRGRHIGDVLIPDKAAIAVVTANGERTDVVAPANEVLHLGGERDLVAGLGVAVEQRPDADGVAGRDQTILAGIVTESEQTRSPCGWNMSRPYS